MSVMQWFWSGMCVVLAAVLAAAPSAAMSEESEEKGFPIRVSEARSHPNLGVPVGVAYLTLHNESDRDDRLVKVETSVAMMTELHESLEVDGVMKMKHHPEGFALKAGGRLDLVPGGKHVMLMQLQKKLVEGESIPLTLVFEHAGRLELSVPVVPRSP